MLWRKIKPEGFRCSLTACENTFYFALFIVQLLVTDTDSLVALTLETYATIPTDLNAIFQFWKLTHISANYLLQSFNYLSCIQRFVRINVRIQPSLFGLYFLRARL